MPPIPTEDSQSWHLDKRVSIGILLALIANAGAGLVFVSKLETRVTAAEDEARRHERADEFERQERKETFALLSARMDRMTQERNERDAVMLGRIDRIDTKVDQLLARNRP